ncbi:hybrid sensor histidine kinase/response regulator [Arenimonas sp. MALMAid1274]|uniref:hybrid sensor histidine kinase/response regulator n=1 Tax=Arenimonas sp. MALMAid1274 TaxID=3411630 RepID=UPI003B9E3159
MKALWPLMQEELARLLPQLRRFADALAHGEDGAAAAQWQRRLAGFQGATRALGDTPLPAVIERMQGLWQGVGSREEHVAQARRWMDALTAIAAQEFEPAIAALQALANEPAAIAVPAPAAVPAGVDARLRALFATEVDDKCNAMERVLLQLEQSPERLELVAPLMRAAHSIKGAARAVRNEDAVRLAHALEDCLSAAQKRALPLDAERLDLALRAVDRLRRLGTDDSPAARQAAAELCTALLAAPGPAAPATAPGAATLAAPVPTYIDVEDTDPILRVRASHVGRLIALAGTGMVENRRLRPFGERQQRLRRDLAAASRLLDELHHELGAPSPQTPVGSQLAGLRQQLSSSRGTINQWLDEFGAYERESADLTERLYHHASQTRLRPFADIAESYPRMVRDLSRQLGKRARAVLSGEQLAVDRDVLERLDAPLTHLLRNALDHGIEDPARRLAAGKPEEGLLNIAASYRAGMLSIEVSDDGAGIDFQRVRARLRSERGLSDEEAAALDEDTLSESLFAAGFTTREEVSEISGRGVGLDVVRQMLKQLEGSVRLHSTPGAGTRFSLLVPISRAVTRAVAVGVAGETYAFPLLRIERLVRASPDQIHRREGMQYLALEGQNIGLVPLAELLDLGNTRGGGEGTDIVVVAQDGRRAGFAVDSVLGEFDLATRPLDARLGRVADLAALALMPDGAPVVLLDTEDLMRGALERERQHGRLAGQGDEADASRRRRVLVVDDSISVRELVRQLLSAKGFDVEVAVDGMDAWMRLREWPCDLVVTDVDMPRMDGIELTRSIKQDPRLRNLPVVIVSYRDRPEDRSRGLEVHADAYLTKSDFQEHGFLDVVHSLIGDAEAPE